MLQTAGLPSKAGGGSLLLLLLLCAVGGPGESSVSLEGSQPTPAEKRESSRSQFLCLK